MKLETDADAVTAALGAADALIRTLREERLRLHRDIETLSRAVTELSQRETQLRAQREEALLHHRIGEAAAGDGLPVDWDSVAAQMAEALTDGREEDRDP